MLIGGVALGPWGGVRLGVHRHVHEPAGPGSHIQASDVSLSCVYAWSVRVAVGVPVGCVGWRWPVGLG